MVTQSIIQAMITEQTCGEMCWHAKEDICRCSCGGRNHGVLRTQDGIQPDRTSKIDGDMYTLIGVSKDYADIYHKAQEINVAAGKYFVDKQHSYSYTWRETDKHAPARLKPANQSQIERWTELTAYRNIERWEHVYLLWQKV
jgi:hypothetical protein